MDRAAVSTSSGSGKLQDLSNFGVSHLFLDGAVKKTHDGPSVLHQLDVRSKSDLRGVVFCGCYWKATSDYLLMY